MTISTNKNKGGAPKKEVTQDKEIKFSCTPELYDFLSEQSKAAGYATAKRTNVAAFLRDFLITMLEQGRYEVIKPSEITLDMMKELAAVGINLNQAMHAMNTYNTDFELVNLTKNVELTRKILLAITKSISAPQKLPVTNVQGEAA